MAEKIYNLIGGDKDTNSFYIEKEGRHGVFQDALIIETVIW